MEYPEMLIIVPAEHTGETYTDKERTERVCPCCFERIGFVNFEFRNGRVDFHTKCMSKFIYKLFKK